MGTFVKTVVFTDACLGTQFQPLPTAHYSVVGGPPNDDIPVYSGRVSRQGSILTTVNHLGDGMATLTASLNADQFIQGTCQQWSTNSQWSVIWLYLRAGVALAPSYAMFIANENGGTGGFWNFLQLDATGGNIVYQWFANDQPISNVLGSMLTFGVCQPKHNGVASGHPLLTAMQGTTVLGQGDLTLSPGGIIASGRAGFQINSLDGNGNHGTSSFETGIGPLVVGNFAENV